MRRLLFETVILPRIFFSSKFPTEHKLRKPNPNPDTAPPQKIRRFPIPQTKPPATLQKLHFKKLRIYAKI